MKNIFNKKIWVVVAPSLPSTPQYFLHPPKKLLPAVVISLRMEEKQSMYRLKS